MANKLFETVIATSQIDVDPSWKWSEYYRQLECVVSDAEWPALRESIAEMMVAEQTWSNGHLLESDQKRIKEEYSRNIMFPLREKLSPEQLSKLQKKYPDKNMLISYLESNGHDDDAATIKQGGDPSKEQTTALALRPETSPAQAQAAAKIEKANGQTPFGTFTPQQLKTIAQATGKGMKPKQAMMAAAKAFLDGERDVNKQGELAAAQQRQPSAGTLAPTADAAGAVQPAGPQQAAPQVVAQAEKVDPSIAKIEDPQAQKVAAAQTALAQEIGPDIAAAQAGQPVKKTGLLKKIGNVLKIIGKGAITAAPTIVPAIIKLVASGGTNPIAWATLATAVGAGIAGGKAQYEKMKSENPELSDEVRGQYLARMKKSANWAHGLQLAGTVGNLASAFMGNGGGGAPQSAQAAGGGEQAAGGAAVGGLNGDAGVAPTDASQATGGAIDPNSMQVGQETKYGVYMGQRADGMLQFDTDPIDGNSQGRGYADVVVDPNTGNGFGAATGAPLTLQEDPNQFRGGNNFHTQWQRSDNLGTMAPGDNGLGAAPAPTPQAPPVGGVNAPQAAPSAPVVQPEVSPAPAAPAPQQPAAPQAPLPEPVQPAQPAQPQVAGPTPGQTLMQQQMAWQNNPANFGKANPFKNGEVWGQTPGINPGSAPASPIPGPSSPPLPQTGGTMIPSATQPGGAFNIQNLMAVPPGTKGVTVPGMSGLSSTASMEAANRFANNPANLGRINPFTGKRIGL